MPAATSLKNSALNEKLAMAMQSKMPVGEAPGLRDAVNFDESGTVPVHRWFRYREGFSPTILDKLNGHRRVFDPFCGCGTTLIEAKRRGVSAVGTDVNPLAVFVAKVKTRNYNANHGRDFESWARRASQCRRAWPAPAMPLLPKLFQPEALNELLKLRVGLEACEDRKIRDLLLLCWLNILESCSNVFKWGIHFIQVHPMGCGLAAPEQECEIARIVRVAAKPTHTRIHCGGSLRAATPRIGRATQPHVAPEQ